MAVGAGVIGTASVGHCGLKPSVSGCCSSSFAFHKKPRIISPGRIFHKPLNSHSLPKATYASAFRVQDVSQSFEEHELDEEQLGFFDRLSHAWQILFPSADAKGQSVSNADIAKQRLKMILISDRCSITDDAKKRIVDNIVGALADFVEIESEEKVQLNVLSDPDLGTVYSVTVPVRRVKPEYQDYSRELQNVEIQHTVGGSEVKTVGIRFEYPGLES